jgi:hypothetical protein
VLFPAEILDQVVDTIEADRRRADLAITAKVPDPPSSAGRSNVRWTPARCTPRLPVCGAESVRDISGVIALKVRNPRAVTWAEEEP